MGSEAAARLGEALCAALQAALGDAPVAAGPVSGGDINRAFRVELASGETLFLKSRDDAPAGFFACEARGLAWLAEAGCLRVPRVRATGDEPAYLALEWLEPGRPAPDFDTALGRGLAALHASGADAFGLDRDNWIGSLPQANAPAESWPEFYAERRLRPLLRSTRDAGLLPAQLARQLETLCASLGERVGPPEAPARLHGDLWAGNLHCDATGRPCLVDPAVYGGHREVDLAMMRLFGGFSRRCFEAYAEALPLAEGAAARVSLYQLYPLLVHLRLFGRGYLASLADALAQARA